MDTLKDIIRQMESWPASVLVVVVLNFVGNSMKRSKLVPNHLIPSMLMLSGAIIYIFVGDPNSINSSRNPMVMLALYGILLGAMAWLAHALIWKAIEKRFPSIANGDNKGDTDVYQKPKDHHKPKDQ